MPYLCTKQLTAGGVTYYPGERIPDGVILPERSRKLERSGYLSDFCRETELKSVDGTGRLFTVEEVATRVAEALAAAESRMKERLAECQGYELQETGPGADEPTVLIVVNSTSDGKKEPSITISATPEEIRQVFSLMQQSAEDSVKQIANVTNEHVLILLHAADSRKTVRNAAREQAERLSSSGEPGRGIETAETGTEGADP
ncbi:MAG: hypothetical protein K2N94_07840 [Lachnospiraceae bacterium]|nr:hypothetical protein [Lachnospiraceae bacterium]